MTEIEVGKLGNITIGSQSKPVYVQNGQITELPYIFIPTVAEIGKGSVNTIKWDANRNKIAMLVDGATWVYLSASFE